MKRKKTRYLDSSVFYIILGVLLALGINWGLAFALNTDMPVVAVESYSMLPAFSKGDILVLQGIPREQLKIGDIIVFSPGPEQTPVVHRIIAINPDSTFQTKGDNNNSQLPFERRIEPPQIHGRAILIIPYLGWLKIGIIEYFLPNLLWFVLTGGIIALIYMGVKFYRKDGFFRFW